MSIISFYVTSVFILLLFIFFLRIQLFAAIIWIFLTDQLWIKYNIFKKNPTFYSYFGLPLNHLYYLQKYSNLKNKNTNNLKQQTLKELLYLFLRGPQIKCLGSLCQCRPIMPLINSCFCWYRNQFENWMKCAKEKKSDWLWKLN